VGRKFDHHPGWVIEAVAWRQGMTKSPFEGRQIGIESAARIWFLQKSVSMSATPLPRRIAEHCGGLPLHRRMEAAMIAWEMEGSWDVEEFWKRLSLSKRNSREVIATFPGWEESQKLRKIWKGSIFQNLLNFADEYPVMEVCRRLLEKGVKTSLFQKRDYRKDILLKILFGADWRRFLSLSYIRQRNAHDLVYALGMFPRAFNVREKVVLPHLLEIVPFQRAIDLLREVPAELPLNEVKNWAVERQALITYPKAENSLFAKEALKWALKEASYYKWEGRFVSSQDIPSPFPTDKVWYKEGMRGYFLKREDVRGIFLGEYTNCCQHPEGAGSACAKHGQESPDGGFFVVEDRVGKIIAQSWVWVDNVCNNSVTSMAAGVCFDNIETLTLGSRMEAVEDIYRKAAHALYSLGFEFVTLGSGDLEFGAFTRVRLAPAEYDGYRDSKRQTLIEREEEVLDI
jgi:hypothetical protein